MIAATVLLGATVFGGAIGRCDAIDSPHLIIQPDLRNSAEPTIRQKSVLPPYDLTHRGGGGEPFDVYPPGVKQPLEMPGDRNRLTKFLKADVNDPVARKCAPGDSDGKWWYDVKDATLYPFIVPKDQENFKDAAVIVAPGGGFQFLTWHKEGTQIATWLNTLGYSAFVLRYRVPSTKFQHSTPEARLDALWNDTRATGERVTISGKALPDAQRAVSIVRSRAAFHGYSPSRVGMIGFSAGGMLAAEASYTHRRVYEKIDAIDDFSHVPDFVLLIYAAGSPYQVQGLVPPTFVALAQDDQCVSSQLAEAYVTKLEEAGNHPETHVFAEGRHGYGDCTMYTEQWRWMSVCAWTANAEVFLGRIVAGGEPAVRG